LEEEEELTSNKLMLNLMVISQMSENVALSENQSSQTKNLMDTIDIPLFFLDPKNQPMSHKREGKNTQTKPIKISHKLIFNQKLLFTSNYIEDHSNQTYCFHMWLSYIIFSCKL